MHRGDQIMNQIANGNAQWSDLLKENDFFKDHVHYLQVCIAATNEEDHRAWFGLCESRLRILIAGLDSTEHGTHAYPFTKFFTRTEKLSLAQQSRDESEETQEIVTSFFIALRFAYGMESVDLIGCTAEYVYSANSWKDRKKGMDLRIEHVLQKDLPDFVFEGSLVGNEASDAESDDRDICSSGDDAAENAAKSLVVDTTFEVAAVLYCMDSPVVLSGMDSPEDCLASPMKRARINQP